MCHPQIGINHILIVAHFVGRAIADLLFELNATRGTTLVLVTHDERLAARCQRQLRLNAGRLVA